MSLLGIDIGTVGCKAVVFSVKGEQLARSYRDYDIISEKDGYAELNSVEVWEKVKETIREVALQTMNSDPVQTLSTSSLGEAILPVTKNREILGNTLLGSDNRGIEFVEILESRYSSAQIFEITGNIPATFLSMSKVAWIKKYQPEVYRRTDYFMSWADFVCFMLGGVPVANHSLASRTLLFDIQKCRWSDEIFSVLDLDQTKLPPPKSSGNFLGIVNNDLAQELNLGNDVAVISGSHDQCCAAIGCGIKSGANAAMYGMGTFMVVVPVYSQLPDIRTMYSNKLHIEHHAIAGSFISFIYNQASGGMVKWFKQTFCAGKSNQPVGQQLTYADIFAEIKDEPNDIVVVPRFGATGAPDFMNGGKGCIHGLNLNHKREDILRAMLEGISFYVKDFFVDQEGAFTNIEFLTATGGGSVSDKWLQITADILGISIVRNKVSEASSLGAAIIAGIGCQIFSSFDQAIDSLVIQELTITPNPLMKEYYDAKYIRYCALNQSIIPI
jgi:xylulokinase